MKTLILSAVLAVSLPQFALACDADTTQISQTLKEMLSGSQNPQTQQIAGYLNDDFYGELACRLMTTNDFTDPETLTPEALNNAMAGMLNQRSQSDALILILIAMQDAMGET